MILYSKRFTGLFLCLYVSRKTGKNELKIPDSGSI